MVPRPPRSPVGTGGAVRRIQDVGTIPDSQSVHLVDNDAVVCGQVDVDALEPLGDRPWSSWQPLYRCRECNHLRPDG